MSETPKEISKLRIGEAVRNIKDAIARLAISALADALDGIASRLLTAENKLSGIASGAQVNVIESVKVNGTALPVQSKAVDISVPDTAATTTSPGLMSAEDKVKLNGIASGATKVVVDAALSSTSENPVQNKAVKTALDEKAGTSHTHDDRYYTESETDTLLAEKSGTGHTHDDRYYTETETDTLLSEKAPASHNHDNRYYTETETDSLLNGKSDTSHTHTPSSIGAVAKTGDTMSGDLTIQGLIAASLGNVPAAACDIGTDLNNAVLPGLYMYLSSHDHRPTSTGGALLVVRYNQNMFTQLAFCNSSSSSVLVYARHYYQGTWGAWVRLSTSADYPYKRTNLINTTAAVATTNAWTDTGLTVDLEAGHLYAIAVAVGSGGGVLGVQLRAGGTINFEHEVGSGQSMANLSPVFYCNNANTYQLWVKRAGTGSASYRITDIGNTQA